MRVASCSRLEALFESLHFNSCRSHLLRREWINFRWSKDSRSFAYIYTRGGVSNIWSFPLDDTPPKQLTNFKTEEIYNFDWSADRKQLVLARGPITSDVFLIRDFLIPTFFGVMI
ncbi:MAG: PD40 domain-containing protein [Pyrinomonadaceae bacterium]|nr:PD40 domain-containing protein [Pyrinomonadaceae bacterium]